MLRKDEKQQRQARLINDIEMAKRQKSANDEIKLLRRETQEKHERRQIFALQLERASIEQENQNGSRESLITRQWAREQVQD